MFEQVLKCWGSDEFSEVFKYEIKSLELGVLPLDSCCNHSAVIDKDSIDPVVLSSHETDRDIQIKTGVFFCEILSGCACSDDPSQAMIHENSYCEINVIIDKDSAKARFVNV